MLFWAYAMKTFLIKLFAGGRPAKCWVDVKHMIEKCQWHWDTAVPAPQRWFNLNLQQGLPEHQQGLWERFGSRCLLTARECLRIALPRELFSIFTAAKAYSSFPKGTAYGPKWQRTVEYNLSICLFIYLLRTGKGADMSIAHGNTRIPFLLCKNDRVSFKGGCTFTHERRVYPSTTLSSPER